MVDLPLDDIVTERLCLRLLEPCDAPWIAREIVNPKVQEWLTAPPHPYGLKDAEAFISDRVANPRIRAIVFEGAPVGVIGLEATRGPSLEFGYWVAERAWGRGIMSEAAEAILDWHWAHSTRPVISGWIEGNDRSAAILRKLGFESVGTAQRWANWHGREMTLERVRMKRRSARAA